MVAQIAHLYIIAQRYNFSFDFAIFLAKKFEKYINLMLRGKKRA